MHLVFSIFNAFKKQLYRIYVTLHIRKRMYYSACYTHQTYLKIVLLREGYRENRVKFAGKVYVANYVFHDNQRTFVIFAENQFRSAEMGLPERTLSCRSCVSERYDVVNQRRDDSDILFNSYIHRRLHDTIYRLGNGAVKILKLLNSLSAPPADSRDGRFKIIKHHK